METKHTSAVQLEDIPVNIKIKLSGLWVSLMIIYLYVDFIALFEPGSIENILDGIVWGEIEVTQAWALSAIILMAIPTLMIPLSLLLPAKKNRTANIVVGAVYVLVGIGSMIGEDWVFYIFGHCLGIVILLVLVWHAWNWPSAPGATIKQSETNEA